MSDEDDFEKQMGDVQSRAQKLGVSGSGGSSASDADGGAASADSDGRSPAHQQALEQDSSRTTGGPDEHEYPNPDRELGALSDVYENNNVFLSPEMVDAVGDLWDDVEYEWKKSHDTELNKNWDFYMACFRVIVNRPELVREELGMDDS